MLFPSTLLVCENLDPILSRINNLGHTSLANNPDIFYVNTYTIDTIRQIGKFLSQKPFSHQSKIIIIQHAHQLNLESQNALLKNLEEPGIGNYFILQTQYPGLLLDTILSRCQVIYPLPTAPAPTSIISFPVNLDQSLALVDSLGLTKESILPWLQSQLIAYQQLMVRQPSQKFLQTISKLLKSAAMTRANIDPRSVLDFLFLS